MKNDNTCKLAELALEIANYVDRHGEIGDNALCDELGLGYRVLSGKLRRGVKDLIELQERYSAAISAADDARFSVQEKAAFMAEIFGDENPEELPDELKARLKAYVLDLLDEED